MEETARTTDSFRKSERKRLLKWKTNFLRMSRRDTPSCVRTAYVRRNLNVRLASPVTNLVNQQGEPQLKGGAFLRHSLSHSCGSIRLDAQEGDRQNWSLAETPFVSIGPAVYSLLW